MQHSSITQSNPQVGDEVFHHEGGNVYTATVERIEEGGPFVLYSLKINGVQKGFNRYARKVGSIIEAGKIKGVKY